MFRYADDQITNMIGFMVGLPAAAFHTFILIRI